MSTFLAVLIALAAVWFVWRFLRTLFHPRQPAGPVDPYSSVREPRNGSPRLRSGAVAIEEPEDDDPVDCFPPRKLS